VIKDFLYILLTVIIVMDPVGAVPQFIAITGSMEGRKRKAVIMKSILIAAAVILIFLLTGKFLLIFFGIMPGAFYISGGILFFIIAFEMIYSKPGSRHTPGEEEGAGAHVAIFPLAIPIIAGPGLLTVIMMFMTNEQRWLYSLSLLLPALVIGLLCTYLALRSSAIIMRLLGTIGILVLEKVMGLIMTGFAVQFVYNGLTALGILKATP
jgi:multiple antibiotic resistance protein